MVSWIAPETSGNGATIGLQQTTIAMHRHVIRGGRLMASITSSAAGRGIVADGVRVAFAQRPVFAIILRAIRLAFGWRVSDTPF